LMNLVNLYSAQWGGLQLQNNNLINSDTAYDANFIAWLGQKNPDWTNQVSPSYCSLLQFSAADYNVNEGDGSTTITVTRSEMSQGAVSVKYATSDGTAASSDYAATSGTLNWANGDTTDKTFTVNLTDDSEVENDETFIVSLSNPSAGAQLGEPNTAVVTITDNDFSMLQFSAADYNVNEGDGSATITVTRSEMSQGAVSVNYATSDGTAASSDYTATSSTLNWANGDTTDKTFTVNLTDDSEQENDETFIVSLSNPSAGAQLGEPNTAVVTITDNDSAKKTLTVTKSGSGTVTSSASGIDCGTDCSEDYNFGTQVTLTATPESGSTFIAWSGSCSGTSCSVTMDTNHTVNAHFETQTNSICDTVTQIPKPECEALVTLYNSTDGDNWKNKRGWNVTNTPCSWYQVTCNGGHVSWISLDSNQLSGTLPPELGNLSNLTLLLLDSNELSGEIPQELGQLSRLTTLYLNSNELSGTIPPELGQLSSLQDLLLNSNQLCGKIPSELMNLTNLGTPPGALQLQNNNLINSNTAYDANFIAWLDQNNLPWRNQVSPSYCISLNDLVIDLGPQYGIWAWMNNSYWHDIHSLSPISMVIGDIDGSGQDDIIIDFGETSGIHLWMNNESWTPLHSLSPESMTTGDMDDNGLADVIIDFGSQYGIWFWMNNKDWVKLHSVSPNSMTTGDMDGNGQADVIIDFGSPDGIWLWMNNKDWVKLHPLSADSMTTGDMDGNGQADVIIDFGEDYGIWGFLNNNSNSWTQLHSLSSENMTTGDMDGNGQADVIIDFGLSDGILVWMNNSTWVQLHSLSSKSMTTGYLDNNTKADVIIDFGEGIGILLKMNNDNWVKLLSGSSEGLVTGNIDGLPSP